MRKLLIRILERWLSKLQPSTDFVHQGLSYDAAVKAIKAQTENGRKTFYFKLVNSISRSDKKQLQRFLNHHLNPKQHESRKI